MFLGLDTSNYTTSVALYDGEKAKHVKRLLPVKAGERGIRQSDAVFHHTKAYPELFSQLTENGVGNIKAIGASVTPTTQKGSYMPCFLVGEAAGRALSSVLDVDFYGFSHQQGHIAAALYSAKRLDLLNEKFLAFHVSGGTTEIVLCEPVFDDILNVSPVCATLDLNAGQAVDRIGVRLGAVFPAGKAIEEMALQSDRVYKNKIKLYDGNCSLSGLENKCISMLEKNETASDTARFLLDYIGDTVIAMALHSFEKLGEMPIVFAGGVMSNSIIRDKICSRFVCSFAEPEFSCDNACGIAVLTSIKYGRLCK